MAYFVSMSSFEINFNSRGNCGKTNATAQDKDSAYSARSAIARARNPARVSCHAVPHEFNRTSKVRFRFDTVWFRHQWARLEQQLQHPRGITPCREWINPSDKPQGQGQKPGCSERTPGFLFAGEEMQYGVQKILAVTRQPCSDGNPAVKSSWF
jgi:hypothetical protein